MSLSERSWKVRLVSRQIWLPQGASPESIPENLTRTQSRNPLETGRCSVLHYVLTAAPGAGWCGQLLNPVVFRGNTGFFFAVSRHLPNSSERFDRA